MSTAAAENSIASDNRSATVSVHEGSQRCPPSHRRQDPMIYLS